MQAAGAVQVALVVQDGGEVVKAGGGLPVRGTAGGLENPERALHVGARPSDVSSILKRAAKIAKSERNFGVLPRIDTLPDGQGALAGGSRLRHIIQLAEYIAKMTQGDRQLSVL